MFLFYFIWDSLIGSWRIGIVLLNVWNRLYLLFWMDSYSYRSIFSSCISCAAVCRLTWFERGFPSAVCGCHGFQTYLALNTVYKPNELWMDSLHVIQTFSFWLNGWFVARLSSKVDRYCAVVKSQAAWNEGWINSLDITTLLNYIVLGSLLYFCSGYFLLSWFNTIKHKIAWETPCRGSPVF